MLKPTRIRTQRVLFHTCSCGGLSTAEEPVKCPPQHRIAAGIFTAQRNLLARCPWCRSSRTLGEEIAQHDYKRRLDGGAPHG